MYQFAIVALLALAVVRVVDFIDGAVPAVAGFRSAFTFLFAIGAVWALDYSLFEGFGIATRSRDLGMILSGFIIAGMTVYAARFEDWPRPEVVGMLALGVMLISRTSSYTGSLTGILFGDILGVSGSDLVILGAGALLALALSAILYRPFLALCFNERKAELLGMMPKLAHAAMLSLVTVAVVTSFRTVGSLLVFGLMVAPPATAALVARRVPTVMLAAFGFGIAAVGGGLLISYHYSTAASATIAALAVVIFFVVLTATGFKTRPA